MTKETIKNIQRKQENNSLKSVPSLCSILSLLSLQTPGSLRIAVRRQVVSVLTTEINFLKTCFTCRLWPYNGGSRTGRKDSWKPVTYSYGHTHWCARLCTHIHSLALMLVPLYCSACLRNKFCLLLMKSYVFINELHHSTVTKESFRDMLGHHVAECSYSVDI